jgi:hypothetical protein
VPKETSHDVGNILSFHTLKELFLERYLELRRKKDDVTFPDPEKIKTFLAKGKNKFSNNKYVREAKIYVDQIYDLLFILEDDLRIVSPAKVSHSLEQWRKVYEGLLAQLGTHFFPDGLPFPHGSEKTTNTAYAEEQHIAQEIERIAQLLSDFKKNPETMKEEEVQFLILDLYRLGFQYPRLAREILTILEVKRFEFGTFAKVSAEKASVVQELIRLGSYWVYVFQSPDTRWITSSPERHS